MEERKERIRQALRQNMVRKVSRMTFLLEYVGQEILAMYEKGYPIGDIKRSVNKTLKESNDPLLPKFVREQDVRSALRRLRRKKKKVDKS